VFHNRSGNRLKVLLWDGNGVWLCQRRLHQGGFVWPKANDACFSLTRPMAVADYRGRLAAFIGGIPGSLTGLNEHGLAILNT